MALLHMLRNDSKLKLTVAHFDHGMRSDSKKDRLFVQETVRNIGLPFVYHEGKLGLGTSEAVARQARYEFLQTVRRATGASHILTAHHYDDVLETVVLNLIRGTGRKGLSPMQSRASVMRPLLRITKKQLVDYAKIQGLVWREDPTNTDTRYLRNYVRHVILPMFNDEAKKELTRHVDAITKTNGMIDEQITHYLHLQPGIRVLDRHTFIMLPHAVAREVMAGWLRNLSVGGLNRPMIERLVSAAKTYAPGKSMDIDGQHHLKITHNSLVLE